MFPQYTQCSPNTIHTNIPTIHTQMFPHKCSPNTHTNIPTQMFPQYTHKYSPTNVPPIHTNIPTQMFPQYTHKYSPTNVPPQTTHDPVRVMCPLCGLTSFRKWNRHCCINSVFVCSRDPLGMNVN